MFTPTSFARTIKVSACGRTTVVSEDCAVTGSGPTRKWSWPSESVTLIRSRRISFVAMVSDVATIRPAESRGVDTRIAAFADTQWGADAVSVVAPGWRPTE